MHLSAQSFIPKQPRVPRKRETRTAPTPPAAPMVVSAVVDTFNGSIDVTFDQPVTWDGVQSGYFDTSAGPGFWYAQVTANVLRLGPGCGVIFAPGISWSWDQPDTFLSPIPDPTQTGVCT